MSDPLHEVLTAHKSDQNRAVEHRRTLLEQLYATTLSFLDFKAPGFRHNDLASFLDANDIAKGRTFALSTLPGADILGHGNQQSSEPLRRTQAQQSQQQQQQHGASAPPDHATPPKASNSASDQSSLPQAAREGTSAGISQQAIDNIGESDRVVNGAGTGAGAASEKVGVERSAPQSEVDASKRTGTSQESSSLERVLLAPSERQSNQNSLTGTIDHGRLLGRESLHEAASAAEPATHPGEQPNQNDRDLTRTGPPDVSTPINQAIPRDEQGRSTEIPSLKKSGPQATTPSNQDGGNTLSKPVKPPSDLPSQFLHGSLDADHPMIDAENFRTETEVNQDVQNATRKPDDGNQSMRAASGFREHVVSGLNGDALKDVTFSRRPPMRIDTRMSTPQTANGMASGIKTAPISTSTPQTANSKQQPIQSASAQSPPERMTTRYSSGTLRHKSVSEIMGETPRGTLSQADKAHAESHRDESAIIQTPKSATSFVSPDPAAFKLRLNEIKERDKNSKLSTVVFAKPQANAITRPTENAEMQQIDVKETPIKDRDYLLTLLVAQVFTTSPNRRVERQPLTALIKSAHKTLSTSDLYVDFRERQDTRILSKVHYLQDCNKWSLRQPERSVEPERSATHWDVLLGQMKWMRTDFREEGKWKSAAARHLANACAQWVATPVEKRHQLQVKIKTHEPRPRLDSSADSQAAVTPDLIHSTEDDASDAMDDDFQHTSQGEPPAAIFSLPPDMFVFGLNKSPASDKILQELPLYQPNAEVQEGVLNSIDFLPDSSWKLPIIPVSKYVQGKIVRSEEEPPRKKSRHHYLEDNDFERHEEPLNRENDSVALFDPEHKHIRDRIHTGHAFRPPSEHGMPSQAFFETRQPSQWTLAEDDELRRLVREYAYNWSLISSCLASPSTFSSGAERRTPWECFERWITLEGMPAEMSKVNYFRAYHSRLQAAARSYEAQQQALMQQHPHNAAQISRRRSTQPFTVDRRKNNKHIHLIDAMRKLAKKRETKLLKDQHSASTAALRKANEPPKPRQQMHTPQEFSRIKYERQVQREEHLKAHRLQLLQQHKAMAASRSGQQMSSQLPGSQHRNIVQGVPPTNNANLASSIPQLRAGNSDPARNGPQMPRLMNTQTNGAIAHNSQGVPHAPMQPHMQVSLGQRMPPQMGSDSMRMYQEVTRVQAEQQAQLQRQRQQQHSSFNGQVSSSHSQTLNALNQSNPNMLASTDSHASPATKAVQQASGVPTSPRPNQPQALSSGLTPAINQISNQIKRQNPQASPEQVQRATNEQLFRISQQAMQAAAGNPAATAAALSTGAGMPGVRGLPNGNTPVLNHQQYAQMMREQQRIQSRDSSTGSATINGARSATPLNQRSGSAQSGRGLSQSPRAGQVGVAGGQ